MESLPVGLQETIIEVSRVEARLPCHSIDRRNDTILQVSHPLASAQDQRAGDGEGRGRNIAIDQPDDAALLDHLVGTVVPEDKGRDRLEPCSQRAPKAAASIL